MKKLLKFLSFFILFILIILFTAPVLFKGKIMKIAKEQINNSVNAKADFADLSLSFFKNFPYLNAGIKDLSVIGIEDFEGDTLVYIKSLELAVNVISAIKMENIEVKKISISEPMISAMVLENGKANWDVAKESEEEETEEVDTTTSDFNTKIALKTFSIIDADIYYTDNESGMSASLEDFDFNLSGDFSKDFSALLITSNVEKLNFIMSGIKYLKDVELDINMDVDADLKAMKFVLQENSFALNNFILKLDGAVEMPDSADMSIDMTYSTNNADFKSLLSLVPAVYMRDYEALRTSGNLGLNGTIKGTVGETSTPDVDGQLKVTNASFSYPDLPKSADNINIDVAYHYDGRQMDNTTVDVNKFHVEFGGNPIDMTLNLKTPISDPFINSQLNANIDLTTFADIIPLEDTEIRGKIVSNLDVMGNMSTIENEQYEDFKAQGGIQVSDFFFNSPDVPKPFSISLADLAFSPKFVEVKSFNAKMGNSDFGLNGKVTDFLPFALNDKTIKGKLNFTAGTIDLNELMASESTEEVVAEESDTSALEVIEVPGNIDFTLNSSISNLYYDKMEMKNVVGMIYIRDSKVVMEKLQMNAFSGEMTVTGEYNTQDIKNPIVDFSFKADKIDIPQAFASFGILQKIAPIASKATGKVSLGMDYSSFLNSGMKPILKSIVGAGNLSSEKIGVKGANAFNAIGNQLNLDEFKEFVLNDLNVDYEILAGKLLVNPFETKMGKTNLMIAGEHGFDNIMDYGINISAPKELFGSSNSKLNALYDANPIKGFDPLKSETVDLLVRLTGDMNNPKVKINPVAGMKETATAVKKEIKANAQQAIDQKKDEAKAQAKAEADKIMAEANKQADEIRKQAKIAADKIRAEANANADKMVKEAKNPLLKKAAEVAAKEVREEGEKRARQIEKEADTKAQKVIDTAQNKADKLLK